MFRSFVLDTDRSPRVSKGGLNFQICPPLLTRGLLLLVFCFYDFVNAQNTPCQFDKETLQFAGT
ncbi:MAG TPA: hypothetical protein VF596_18140, partial [Pyrinomonadaceae bacterium]